MCSKLEFLDIFKVFCSLNYKTFDRTLTNNLKRATQLWLFKCSKTIRKIVTFLRKKICMIFTKTFFFSVKIFFFQIKLFIYLK